MKTVAVILIVLVVAVAGCLGYGLLNTPLQVIGKGLQAVPAAQRQAQFDQLRSALRQQSLLGTALTHGELGPAEHYSYYIYTLRLKNRGLVAAEMVEMQISPLAGDALFYGETGEIVIPPGETRDVWCVLLTEGTPHPVRDLIVTYYLWGHPQEVKYTYHDGN